MKHFTAEPTSVNVLSSVRCDRCKAEVIVDSSEAQCAADEYVTIRLCGGYASRYWGDGNDLLVDLCEKCQFELFSEIGHKPQSRMVAPGPGFHAFRPRESNPLKCEQCGLGDESANHAYHRQSSENSP